MSKYRDGDRLVCDCDKCNKEIEWFNHVMSGSSKKHLTELEQTNKRYKEALGEIHDKSLIPAEHGEEFFIWLVGFTEEALKETKEE